MSSFFVIKIERCNRINFHQCRCILKSLNLWFLCTLNFFTTSFHFSENLILTGEVLRKCFIWNIYLWANQLQKGNLFEKLLFYFLFSLSTTLNKIMSTLIMPIISLDKYWNEKCWVFVILFAFKSTKYQLFVWFNISPLFHLP